MVVDKGQEMSTGEGGGGAVASCWSVFLCVCQDLRIYDLDLCGVLNMFGLIVSKWTSEVNVSVVMNRGPHDAFKVYKGSESMMPRRQAGFFFASAEMRDLRRANT